MLSRALEEYEKAIELDPKDADAYYNLGRALVRWDRKEGALVALEKAAQLEPTNPQIRRALDTLRSLLAGSGRHAQATCRRHTRVQTWRARRKAATV